MAGTEAVAPDPGVITPPGFLVINQLPAGSPLKLTVPVDTVQVGFIMVSTTGAGGAGGWGSIITLDEAGDIQPASLVTVKV